MYLLDTNVISEVVRSRPDPRVEAWLERVEPARAFTTAIVVSELLFGVLSHSDPARAAEVSAVVEKGLGDLIGGRVLPFDDAAARVHARLRVATRGRNRPIYDLQIAAVALANGMVMVTRNTANFEDLGLALLNPWLA